MSKTLTLPSSKKLLFWPNSDTELGVLESLLKEVEKKGLKDNVSVFVTERVRTAKFQKQIEETDGEIYPHDHSYEERRVPITVGSLYSLTSSNYLIHSGDRIGM